MKQIFFLIFFSIFCTGYADLLLKDNLDNACPGDFIVTYQNKTYTVMLIRGKGPGSLTIEEISVPSHLKMAWKEWIVKGAPGNSCWVRYQVDTATGYLKNYYSITQGQWMDTSKANQFLTTLLNLRFAHVPPQERKKVARGGGSDLRNLWQPPMIVEGKTVPKVIFEAWKTHWPRDGSELGGKEIMVYLPAESEKYPTYFPYWLQVSGLVEKAKIRIVDSGRGATY